jgi:hypothetical protein
MVYTIMIILYHDQGIFYGISDGIYQYLALYHVMYTGIYHLSFHGIHDDTYLHSYHGINHGTHRSHDLTDIYHRDLKLP